MADHVLIDRVTVEQALSLCESVQGLRTDDEDGSTVWCQELIESLRAALAQAETLQDLIPPDSLFVCDQMGAHVTRVRLAQQAEPDHETRAELAEQQVVQLAEERDHYRNLWQKAQQAEPVQRKPLTEDEIAELTQSYPASSMWRLIVSTVRAIERAHGIGKESGDER